MFRQQNSLASLVILFSLSAACVPLADSFVFRSVLAQSSSVNTAFPVPQSVPSGTKVRINGTPSMEAINQTLADQFKAKYPGTDVKISYDGTNASLKALPQGKIDIAAIGRSLTNAEKAQGLLSTSLTHNKIAVIVGKTNPFKDSLTSEQFAKIFRGEITKWSQVGGSSQAIRFIDRPKNSDLRQAFKSNPVFQKAPFKTGANAVKLSKDSTQAVIKKLGANGIGYAIADQVINNPDVRIISIDEVPPTDPRYPLFQPLGYAYRGSNPTPAAKAFLAYATAPENKQVVETTITENANTPTTPETTIQTPVQTPTPTPQITTSPTVVASPEITPTPIAITTPIATVTEDRRGFPWWWLPLIPFFGAWLWWLLKNRDSLAGAINPPVVAPPAKTNESRIILTPRNCQDAYAYWEVSKEAKAELQKQGGRYWKVRLYDVTDIDMERQTPHRMKEFDCEERSQDMHVSIPLDNRDYITEIGYLTYSGRWLAIARSAQVRVPACEPVTGITAPTTAAGVAFQRG